MGFTNSGISPSTTLLLIAISLVLLAPRVEAFGAGNIASISAVEGKNWRHGDIEDVLKTLAFIKGHKWTSTMIKRVYFGNWLRDYSQAADVGTLKNVQADTIRVLVWIMSFMSFGYATAEFEVTSERLGVYRPEEHIDNPKGYADDLDAREYDPRLRGPVRAIELEIDPETGMKNYIANERGDWATSVGYVKYSLARSIHYGRMYTSGGQHQKGQEEDLCEALRCLGQGLHTLEDWGAHTNYCELVLREMGMVNVFPHTGTATMMNIHGHHVFPLVTGTFGMVDFFHSVLGEATDHFAQSEIEEMDTALGNSQTSGSSNSSSALTGLLSKVPGMKDLIAEAEELKRRSEAQAQTNQRGFDPQGYGGSRGLYDTEESQGYDNTRGFSDSSRAPASGSEGDSGIADIDPKQTISQIYPILVFRDKVVRRISSIVEKIPGLEAMMEKISETLSIFIFSLLSPFIRPLIKAASKNLQTGSSGVINASEEHQYEPWTDPMCTDPTHSLLSKDHFSNILNEPAGNVAAAILKFVAPRVLYAWQHTDIPVDHVLNDCVSIFHHPALRDMNNESHRAMFEAVQTWAKSKSNRGVNLDSVLSAQNVREGKNHTVAGDQHAHGAGHAHGHSHGQSHYQQHSAPHGESHHAHGSSQSHSQGTFSNIPGFSTLAGMAGSGGQQQSHSSGGGSSSSIPWDKLSSFAGMSSGSSSHSSGGSMPWDKLSNIPGMSNINKFSGLMPGGGSRELDLTDESDNNSTRTQQATQHASQYSYGQQPQHQQHHDQDTGYNIPPPTGYEQYQHQPQNTETGGWPVYQPPTEGAHTYDYYQGPPGDHSRPAEGHGYSHPY